MRLFRYTIDIARPRDVVWDVFSDFTPTAHWRQYVTKMTPRDTGPVKPGSRIDVSMHMMGEVATYQLTVLTYEPPQLWRHQTNETDFRGHVEYRFDEIPLGTRVTMTMVATPVSLYGWLAVPLLLLSRGRGYRDQLPRLKYAAESVNHAASSPNRASLMR